MLFLYVVLPTVRAKHTALYRCQTGIELKSTAFFAFQHAHRLLPTLHLFLPIPPLLSQSRAGETSN